MFVLGLTGSIATGKSTALEIFTQMGHPTFSADDCVHELYQTDAVPLIENFHPAAIVNARVDRAELARFVLEDKTRLTALEKLVHPLVRKKIDQFISQNRREGAQLVVLDIPLLIENISQYKVDAIALTWCTPQDQKQRALARPGMNEAKLEAILARQMDQEEKKHYADYLINTSLPLVSLNKQLADIVKKCLDNQ